MVLVVYVAGTGGKHFLWLEKLPFRINIGVWLSFQNWLGYTKKKAPIGFHRVVEILQRNNAPVQVSKEPLLMSSCSLLGFGV